MSEEKNSESHNKKGWYDRYYKILLIIPIVMLLFSVVYLYQFNSQNGDIVYKDVSLTGGTTITVFDSETSVQEVRDALLLQFADINVRGISDIRTGRQQAFFVETSAEPERVVEALETFLGYELDNNNSSTEFSGSSLSAGFYQQLRFAIIIAFIFMAVVVFFIFKTPVPSLAVIIAAFADIIMTVVLINILGISLSIGGIVALLMLIGYSVDTDIMLTSRVIRNREGTINERMKDALKTGMTMTLTSIAAISVALIIIFNFSETLKQIFTILLIGLGFDILNTWLTNASILKWYAEAKKL